MVQIYVPKITRAVVKRDGTDVLIVMDNRKVLALPWDAALELARAITIQARRIEEQVKALSIVKDQALLMRSGAPFGLSSHPDILAEAKKEAIHNKELRKAIPFKGITSQEAVGRPTLIQHPPKKEVKNNGKK